MAHLEVFTDASTAPFVYRLGGLLLALGRIRFLSVLSHGFFIICASEIYIKVENSESVDMRRDRTKNGIKRTLRELRRLGFHDGAASMARMAREVGWVVVHDRLQFSVDMQNTKLWVDLEDPEVANYRQILICSMFVQAVRPLLFQALMDYFSFLTREMLNDEPLMEVLHELETEVFAPPHLRFMLYFNGRTMLAEESVGHHNLEARVGTFMTFQECSICKSDVNDYVLPYRCQHIFCHDCKPQNRQCCPHSRCQAAYNGSVTMHTLGVDRVLRRLSHALRRLHESLQLPAPPLSEMCDKSIAT